MFQISKVRKRILVHAERGTFTLELLVSVFDTLELIRNMILYPRKVCHFPSTELYAKIKKNDKTVQKKYLP